MMHSAHIAAFYDWLYRTKAGTTARERHSLSALAFEYSQAAKDAQFAAKFFRYK
jgi:hypothetical protein